MERGSPGNIFEQFPPCLTFNEFLISDDHRRSFN